MSTCPPPLIGQKQGDFVLAQEADEVVADATVAVCLPDARLRGGQQLRLPLQWDWLCVSDSSGVYI